MKTAELFVLELLAFNVYALFSFLKYSMRLDGLNGRSISGSDCNLIELLFRLNEIMWLLPALFIIHAIHPRLQAHEQAFEIMVMPFVFLLFFGFLGWAGGGGEKQGFCPEILGLVFKFN